MSRQQRSNAHPVILIVGAGSLGKGLAALLGGQTSVMMYERNFSTSRELRKGYFVFQENKRAQKVKVQAIRSLAELQGTRIDILIFATKIMDLKKAVAEAAGLEPRYILFPQNGIFDISWTKQLFKTAQICRGVTTMACQEAASGQVTLFYRGCLYIGGEGAKELAVIFRKAGINAKAFRNSIGSIWAKLIFSAVMNPLPVITGQGYDVLSKDQKIWKLVRQAIEEGKATARALRVRLAFNPLKLIQRVRDGDLAGISHRGTIFQDISVGRPTEIDFITKALIRLARQKKIKTLALGTIYSRARAAGA